MESIELLKMRKTPFIIAVNKVYSRPPSPWLSHLQGILFQAQNAPGCWLSLRQCVRAVGQCVRWDNVWVRWEDLLSISKLNYAAMLLQVDRLYAWKSTKDAPMKESLAGQSEHTMSEFRDRMKKCMLDLNEQGLNVALYWENPDIRKYVNIVPTSAITGEGIPDLLQLLVKLTQVSLGSLSASSWTSVLSCHLLILKSCLRLGRAARLHAIVPA